MTDELLSSLASLTPEVKAKLQSLLAQDASIPSHTTTSRRIAEDDKTIASLRRANADLQAQLYATLSEYKNAEKVAKEQMAGLDSSLLALREELSVTLRQKQDTDAQKRVFVREKMDLLREKSELSASDQAMIVELQFRVSSLTDEAGLLQRDKQGLVDTLKTCKHDLETAVKFADAEHAAAIQSESWKSQSEDQAMMIQALQDELEYERSRSEDVEAGRDVDERRTSLLDSTRAADGPWEWRKWMDRSWVRLWERDISGLQDEIADLSMNRSLALARIQANLTGLVGAYMPEGGLERVASDLLRPGALSVVCGDASDGIEALETSSGLSDKKSEE